MRYPTRKYKRTLLSVMPQTVGSFGFHQIGDYTGPMLRARSSAGGYLDIGVDSKGKFDESAAASFAGLSATLYIDRYYSRDGKNYTLYQGNTNKQPRFFEGGQLITDLNTSLPCAYFDGFDDFMYLCDNPDDHTATPNAIYNIAQNKYGFTTVMVTRAITQGSLKYLYMISTGTDALSARQTVQFNANNTLQAVSKSLDADSGAFTSSGANNIYSNVITCNTNFELPTQSLKINQSLVSVGGSGMTAGPSSNTASSAICIGGRGSGSNVANMRFSEITFFDSSLDSTHQTLFEKQRKAFYGTP